MSHFHCALATFDNAIRQVVHLERTHRQSTVGGIVRVGGRVFDRHAVTFSCCECSSEVRTQNEHLGNAPQCKASFAYQLACHVV